MLHLDRLHRAICRMTEIPFSLVRVGMEIVGTDYDRVHGKLGLEYVIVLPYRNIVIRTDDLWWAVQYIRRELHGCRSKQLLPSELETCSPACSSECGSPSRTTVTESR